MFFVFVFILFLWFFGNFSTKVPCDGSATLAAKAGPELLVAEVEGGGPGGLEPPQDVREGDDGDHTLGGGGRKRRRGRGVMLPQREGGGL